MDRPIIGVIESRQMEDGQTYWDAGVQTAAP